MVKLSRSPAILLLIMILALLFAVPAAAKAKKGYSVKDFYTAPSPLPAGVHGDLIRSLKVKVVIPGAPPFYSWQIMYRSSDARGKPNVVTGTVIVPVAWDRGNVICYCAATQGLAQKCAPSFQMRAGAYWENDNIIAVLKAGYAILISDNPGYTTGDYPSYCNGLNQGYAALDIIKASRKIPHGPFSYSDKVVVWGYSQGGQTAPWAGQLQPSYMPGLNLVGVVAGSVSADLIAVSRALDGGPGACYLLAYIAGLYYQYPSEVPLFDLVNKPGRAALEGAMDVCLWDGLKIYMHTKVADLTKDQLSIDDLVAGWPKVSKIVKSMKLGKSPINAPVYLYHGSADPFIPLDQALDLKEDYCKMGMDVSFQVFPTAEHLIPLFQVTPYALAWMKDRFDGTPVSKDNLCSSGPRPVSDAQNPSDDFVIKMDKWHVEGVVDIEKLKKPITIPAETIMTCDANLSSLRVENGVLDMPKFDAKVRVVLPMRVGFSMEQVKPMTGSLFLNSVGTLTINGVMESNFFLKRIGLTPLKIMPFHVKTSEPVKMKLFFKGPVADFCSGKMVFEGETIIPKMRSANIFGKLVSPIYSTLMSGPMKYKYRVYPREPYMY